MWILSIATYVWKLQHTKILVVEDATFYIVKFALVNFNDRSMKAIPTLLIAWWVRCDKGLKLAMTVSKRTLSAKKKESERIKATKIQLNRNKLSENKRQIIRSKSRVAEKNVNIKTTKIQLNRDKRSANLRQTRQEELRRKKRLS